MLTPVQAMEFHGFNSHGNQASSNQNQKNTSGSSQASTAEVGVSPHACTATRQNECHKLHPSTRAPILSPPTNGTNKYTGAELPTLRSTIPSYTRLLGEAHMVGQQHVQVGWQDTHSEGNRSGDRF